jgi:hypothetical protein
MHTISRTIWLLSALVVLGFVAGPVSGCVSKLHL